MADRVLITGARSAAALDLARDFAAAGWEPHLADSVPSAMVRWSSLAHQVHRYPAPRQQGKAFQTRIAEMQDEHDFALIVPSCEEVFHLAAPSLHRILGTRLFAPQLPLLRTLHDKLAFAHTAAQLGLQAPESHPIDQPEDLGKFLGDSHQWVFKPRFSRFGDKALIAPSADRVEQLAASHVAGWLAQRCIGGEEACFHAVAHNGRLIGFAAYGSDWRLGGGARFAFEPLSAARSAALRDIAERLAVGAAIHGQFACDVMFDPAEVPYLLECNPRATSGIHLLCGTGQLARGMADGSTMPPNITQTAFLGPAMVLFGLPQALIRGTLREWRICWKAGRDVISRPGDRAPLLGAMLDAARFTLNGWAHGISTNAATTRDMEWNGEELDE
ncbi:MAG: hypothetical protein J0M19_08560 [Sphingomonadales bacterium]|nr:hypothetical protein [Sphingomonadales bacterium]